MWFVPTFTFVSPLSMLAFGMPSGMEWIVVALIALLIFGKRLPGAARGMGEAFREFKRGLSQGSTPPADETPIAARDSAR